MIYTLAIVGPTASGKTALSLSLAQKLSAEIISLDSMQIYKGMDIGTAKATKEEQELVPHHMLDLVSPTEAYSTEQYRQAVIPLMEDIKARGKSVIFTGGTGLYLDTLMRASADGVPQADTAYREKILQNIKNQDDIHALWERLYAVDPISASAVHENNVRRVIRALEIYEKTGKPKSYFDKLSKELKPTAEIDVICLSFQSRELLYSRINERVDDMLDKGLVSEVRALYDKGELQDGTTASQAIGYKEIISYLKGEASLCDAIELIKLSSRRYAKRQLTWFSHVKAFTIYCDKEDGSLKSKDEILAEALMIIEKNNI